MPWLWVTGSNDFAYTMDALQRSYRLPKGLRHLCIRLRMPHGHGGAGRKPRGNPGLCRQSAEGRSAAASHYRVGTRRNASLGHLCRDAPHRQSRAELHEGYRPLAGSEMGIHGGQSNGRPHLGKPAGRNPGVLFQPVRRTELRREHRTRGMPVNDKPLLSRRRPLLNAARGNAESLQTPRLIIRANERAFPRWPRRRRAYR